jgi:hypothetical protein
MGSSNAEESSAEGAAPYFSSTRETIRRIPLHAPIKKTCVFIKFSARHLLVYAAYLIGIPQICSVASVVQAYIK